MNIKYPINSEYMENLEKLLKKRTCPLRFSLFPWSMPVPFLPVSVFGRQVRTRTKVFFFSSHFRPFSSQEEVVKKKDRTGRLFAERREPYLPTAGSGRAARSPRRIAAGLHIPIGAPPPPEGRPTPPSPILLRPPSSATLRPPPEVRHLLFPRYGIHLLTLGFADFLGDLLLFAARLSTLAHAARVHHAS